jgi:hypothetical protein
MAKISLFLIIQLLLISIAHAQDEVEFQYFDKKMKFKVSPDREFKFRLQTRQNSSVRVVRGRSSSKNEFLPIGRSTRSSRSSRQTDEVIAPVLIANGEMEYIPNGKLIVGFKRTLSELELNNWMKKYSVDFEDIIQLKDGERYIFVFYPGFEVLQLANSIIQDPLVNDVAPDMIKNIKVRSIPTESELNNRKSLLKLESGNQR